jgi:hypothetical protein
MINMLKSVAEIVSAFGTLVVAGIVAYIAYRQHKTDKGRLKLDLYDRRLHAFEAGMKFITHVVENGGPDDQALAAVNRARFECVFLFPPEVGDYFCTLYCKGVDLQYMNKLEGAERAQSALVRAELIKWFIRQIEVLPPKLRPYMGFDE